jgi:hypothetical protein
MRKCIAAAMATHPDPGENENVFKQATECAGKKRIFDDNWAMSPLKGSNGPT